MYGYRLSIVIAIIISIFSGTTARQKGSLPRDFYSVNDFASVKKYDTHIHIERENGVLPAEAEKDNFRLLSINGDWGPLSVEELQRLALLEIKSHPQQISFASSFEVKDWNDKNWQKNTIEYLKKSFDKGAVAVKVWKSIGMRLKDKNGKFVMIDDPRFDPILNFIEKNHITLLSHQGEPRNCWLPIEKMTVKGDKSYFSKHPEYHMYLHPEYPSYEEQINARDRMVAKHPNLKIVSVHLASLEWNVDEIAKRLDRFPNMAVDIAARIEHLQNTASTDWKKIHDFFIKYQDRILYGTDIVESQDNTVKNFTKNTRDRWLNDWKFFVTDETITNGDGITYKGLRLPRAVVDKIYAKNAEKWIPGLLKH